MPKPTPLMDLHKTASEIVMKSHALGRRLGWSEPRATLAAYEEEVAASDTYAAEIIKQAMDYLKAEAPPSLSEQKAEAANG